VESIAYELSSKLTNGIQIILMKNMLLKIGLFEAAIEKHC
jgi:hypothetical protein